MSSAAPRTDRRAPAATGQVDIERDTADIFVHRGILRRGDDAGGGQRPVVMGHGAAHLSADAQIGALAGALGWRHVENQVGLANWHFGQAVWASQYIGNWNNRGTA